MDTLPPTITISDGGMADLTATVEASQPATVQWYSNSVAIPNANLLSYHIAKATPAQDGAVYTVTITNSLWRRRREHDVVCGRGRGGADTGGRR